MKKILYYSLSLIALMAFSTPAFAADTDDTATMGARTTAPPSQEQMMQELLAGLADIRASLTATNQQATHEMPESDAADQTSMTTQNAAIDADLAAVETNVKKGLFKQALDDMKKIPPKIKTFADEVSRIAQKNAKKIDNAVTKSAVKAATSVERTANKVKSFFGKR